MNIFQKHKLAKQLGGDYKQIQDGIKMKNSTKIVAAIIAGVTAVLQVQPVQQWLGHELGLHPAVSALVAGLSAIFALIHNPSAPKPQ